MIGQGIGQSPFNFVFVQTRSNTYNYYKTRLGIIQQLTSRLLGTTHDQEEKDNLILPQIINLICHLYKDNVGVSHWSLRSTLQIL